MSAPRLSRVSAALLSGALATCLLVGGCPTPQTPRSVPTETMLDDGLPNATTPADELSLTPSDRPVTIPTAEDDEILLP